ncbi:mitochondrial substrate carrier family protein [Plasmopara halstedii]|uniref:Mitochondrial substrate carrier family protein n=1 Tax=Plasmopara halstedii TaxID=4781 RepID=A0A0P1AAA7_PLAHL|nr:mitochondrial substrate carrier family protein [Plasmopara halstedii]CEG37284.1 mitochondrial substrate carrier family protein [Plasmopara halstedii]|eukprot:XP_024573653.1 mitochondrial substrate carrier family protein [Plasmopara halstedii]
MSRRPIVNQNRDEEEEDGTRFSSLANRECDVRVLLRRHTTGVVTFGDTADVCTETDGVDVELIQQDALKQLIRHGSVLFAGGVAGSVGKTVTAPLSRLTILFQVHSMVSTRHTDRFSPTMGSAINKVLKNEGVLAFWKGNGASVLHRFPYSAVNFFTFEMVKNSLIAQNYPAFAYNMWTTMFVSGALAGATATVACYPIDLIRTRLATQLNTDIRYTGIRQAVLRISTEEGILGLYRGMGATLMVTVPNLAVNFTLYESLKNYARNFRRNQLLAGLTEVDRERSAQNYDSSPMYVTDTLVCGGAAGIASSLLTFPIDVVRRRLQISAIHAKTAGIKPTPMGIASELFQTQGVRGFFRGLTPELMKVVPMVGITFGTFERLKKMLVRD